MESRAEEAESHGGAMLAMEDHGKTAHNTSVNAQRVMERNTKYKYEGESNKGSEFGGMWNARNAPE